MEKTYIEFNGKKYLTREVDLSLILDNYSTETIASSDYGEVLRQEEEKGIDVSNYDNEIYCYLDRSFLESNPTDAEILLAIIHLEGENQNEKQWLNLAKLALEELAGMYISGKTNMYCDYTFHGTEYILHCYCGSQRVCLYQGYSTKHLANTIITMLTTIRLTNS